MLVLGLKEKGVGYLQVEGGQELVWVPKETEAGVFLHGREEIGWRGGNVAVVVVS